MKRLLSDMAAKAEKREDDKLVGNSDGAGPAIEAGLWTGRDIDFFRQLMQRVNWELVLFCRKGEQRGARVLV